MVTNIVTVTMVTKIVTVTLVTVTLDTVTVTVTEITRTVINNTMATILVNSFVNMSYGYIILEYSFYSYESFIKDYWLPRFYS